MKMPRKTINFLRYGLIHVKNCEDDKNYNSDFETVNSKNSHITVTDIRKFLYFANLSEKKYTKCLITYDDADFVPDGLLLYFQSLLGSRICSVCPNKKFARHELSNCSKKSVIDNTNREKKVAFSPLVTCIWCDTFAVDVLNDEFAIENQYQVKYEEKKCYCSSCRADRIQHLSSIKVKKKRKQSPKPYFPNKKKKL